MLAWRAFIMAKTFRLGIFGAGMITKGSHLPAALASAQVEVTALVDPVVDRARALAQSFGIDPLCVGDPSEVLPGL